MTIKLPLKLEKEFTKKTQVDFFLRFVPLKNIITKWFRLVLKRIKLLCEVKQLKSTTTVEKEKLGNYLNCTQGVEGWEGFVVFDKVSTLLNNVTEISKKKKI